MVADRVQHRRVDGTPKPVNTNLPKKTNTKKRTQLGSTRADNQDSAARMNDLIRSETKPPQQHCYMLDAVKNATTAA